MSDQEIKSKKVQKSYTTTRYEKRVSISTKISTAWYEETNILSLSIDNQLTLFNNNDNLIKFFSSIFSREFRVDAIEIFTHNNDENESSRHIFHYKTYKNILSIVKSVRFKRQDVDDNNKAWQALFDERTHAKEQKHLIRWFQTLFQKKKAIKYHW